jgi:hypothetical protein
MKKRKSYVTFPSEVIGYRVTPDDSRIIVECKDAFYELKQDSKGFVRKHISDKEKEREPS